MIFFILVIIYLFTLYALSKDDFVFMRKNVSQRTIFDTAAIIGIVGLFFSRLVFVLIHPSFAYLNPLVFFIIPYFPGLTLSGFLIGSYITLYFFTIRQKLPTGRIYDIFSLSLLIASSAFFASQAVLVVAHRQFIQTGIFAMCIVILLFLFSFFQNFLQKSVWRDGTIGLYCLFFVSFIAGMAQVIIKGFKSFPAELPYFGFFIFLLFVTFLIKSLRKTGDRL